MKALDGQAETKGLSGEATTCVDKDFEADSYACTKDGGVMSGVGTFVEDESSASTWPESGNGFGRGTRRETVRGQGSGSCGATRGIVGTNVHDLTTDRVNDGVQQRDCANFSLSKLVLMTLWRCQTWAVRAQV